MKKNGLGLLHVFPARSVVCACAAVGLILSATPALAYNGQNAANYADTYAYSQNTSYAYFTNADCTNFVSQSLLAGGESQVGGFANDHTDNHYWFYGVIFGIRDSTYSWSDAEDSWIHWLEYSGNRATFVGVYSLYQQFVQYPANWATGDVAFYDWTGDNYIDHESIAVGNGTDYNNNASFGTPGMLVDEDDSNPTTTYHAFWSDLAVNQDWQRTKIYLMHFN